MLFEKGDTILFIGDSISDYERAKPVGEGLFNAWGKSYVANVGSLLNCMYPELALRITNMGVGGNQVRDLDRRWVMSGVSLTARTCRRPMSLLKNSKAPMKS